MFESIPQAPPDAILGLGEAFRNDPNPAKINLSVGVFQNAQGKTPVLESVKEAEKRLLASEATKTYLSIEGLKDYAQQVQELLFGKGSEILASKRAVTAQSPGGTGALRVAADFIKKHLPTARIWCSKPTWANHAAIFNAAGIAVEYYPYIDSTGRSLDFAGMLDGLLQANRGDVVLLHACCHNPTGIDPTTAQWKQIADLLQEKELLPLVDFAYQGFGDGLEEDAAGLREIARPGQELLVCSSFSKNFGLYCERVGALTVVAQDEPTAERSLSQVRSAIRVNYSNPPRHGAAIVATILGDASLRKQWEAELTQMRERIWEMRTKFVAEMARLLPDRDFSFISSQKGMFSFSGLTPVQVDELRTKFAIYVVVAGGRINVAGMTPKNLPVLCTALASVLN